MEAEVRAQLERILNDIETWQDSTSLGVKQTLINVAEARIETLPIEFQKGLLQDIEILRTSEFGKQTTATLMILRVKGFLETDEEKAVRRAKLEATKEKFRRRRGEV